MDLTHPTIKKYIEILEGTYLLRQLPPYHINIGKRIVKSPKLYIRDSGLLHHLLGIKSMDAIAGHPSLGNSWEGYVISQVARVLPDGWEMYFYRTYVGAECDLILVDDKGDLHCIEIKYSNAPKISKGYYVCIDDLKPVKSYVVIPHGEAYVKDSGVEVIGLQGFLGKFEKA